MANHALFVGWHRPFVGRENEGMEAFNASIAFYSKQVAAGNLESFEPVLIGPHGGDLNGFVLLRGEAQKLHTLRHSEEFLELLTRAAYSVDGIGVIECQLGEALMKQVARWNKVIGK
jgi:hypothetical protein